MPWAALDDGFYDHPKIVQLGNEAAGVYARIIAYCARHLTDGVVPREVANSICGKGKRLQIAQKLIEANMLVDHGDKLVVRDYLSYNPSRAKVQEDKWKAANKKRQQRGMDPLPAPDFNNMSPLLSLGLSQGTETGTSPGTRAGAPDRASPPLPSPVLLPDSQLRDAAPAAAELPRLADSVGWDLPKITAARVEPERAIAWIVSSQGRDGIRNPGGWAWAGFSKGEWPSDRLGPKEPKGQNLAGADPNPSQVLDYCYRCQQQRTLAELDEHAGLCAECAEQEAA